PDRQTPHVVARAVDRIDDPPYRRVPAAPVPAARLLAEHRLTAPALPDSRAHRLLGGAVRLRHRSQIRLRLDTQIERTEARERDRVGGVRKLVREAEVGLHGPPR